MKSVPNGQTWLDLGCGLKKLPGAVGLDIVSLPGVDVVHDLDVRPWPLESCSFDRVVCNHSLSHGRDLVATLAEVHRILKPGGIVEIIAPHYASDNFNTDPTHKFHLGIRSMDYFMEEPAFKYGYYSTIRYRMVVRWISFRECEADFRTPTKRNVARFVGLEHLVNRYPRIYERFFVYWAPPSEVYFKMVAVK